jgi:hypothetical protein
VVVGTVSLSRMERGLQGNLPVTENVCVSGNIRMKRATLFS